VVGFSGAIIASVGYEIHRGPRLPISLIWYSVTDELNTNKIIRYFVAIKIRRGNSYVGFYKKK